MWGKPTTITYFQGTLCPLRVHDSIKPSCIALDSGASVFLQESLLPLLDTGNTQV